MSFQNITALPLGSILQIAFSKGVRTQMSQDYRDFEQVRMAKVAGHAPRSIRFYFQTGLLPANVQWRKPGQQNRPFPRAFQPSTSEHEAFMKECQASVELEANLYERAKASPQKYAEPLQIILNASMVSNKREIARALYKDGTGVIAQVGAASAAVTSPASDKLVFTIDQGDNTRGHVGDFEYDDILVLRDADGTATALAVTTTGSLPAYWKVTNKNRAAGTVTLQGLTSSFASAGTISVVTTQPASGAVFYKYDQPTGGVDPLDLTAAISDYGTVSESLAGLESLAANDGRVTHGITMSGATGSSEYDAAAAALDLSHFNAAMDQAKIEVGQGAYSWKKAMCAPETQSALIESREDDRRFTSKEDARTGSKQFGIQHRQDFIELVDSEYVHPSRIWVLPETKGGEKVIEYHGSDFSTTKAANGDDFHLKVSGGEYVNSMVSFLSATAVLICKHPKSVVKIRNFT